MAVCFWKLKEHLDAVITNVRQAACAAWFLLWTALCERLGADIYWCSLAVPPYILAWDRISVDLLCHIICFTVVQTFLIGWPLSAGRPTSALLSLAVMPSVKKYNLDGWIFLSFRNKNNRFTGTNLCTDMHGPQRKNPPDFCFPKHSEWKISTAVW